MPWQSEVAAYWSSVVVLILYGKFCIVPLLHAENDLKKIRKKILNVMLNFVYFLVLVLLSLFDVMVPSHCFRAVFSVTTLLITAFSHDNWLFFIFHNGILTVKYLTHYWSCILPPALSIHTRYVAGVTSTLLSVLSVYFLYGVLSPVGAGCPKRFIVLRHPIKGTLEESAVWHHIYLELVKTTPRNIPVSCSICRSLQENFLFSQMACPGQ
jgi:hypothetical protein